MPTVVELKKMLKEKGIQFGPKDLKADLEKLLKSITPEKKSKVEVVSAINALRLLVIVRDESEMEINYFCTGYGDLCTNFVFEKSSGTSNEYNFRNVFLPIMRHQQSGWLNKASGLDTQCVFYLSKMIYTILKKLGHSEECIKESFVFLNEFLSRFGCWKHLQISAALSDIRYQDVWNMTVVGEILKDIAFTYNWYPMQINKFKDLTPEMEKKIEEGRAFKASILDRVYDSSQDLDIQIPDVTTKKGARNDIYIQRDSISINRKINPNLIHIIQWGQEGFFYKRETPMTPISIKKKDFVDIPDKSPKSINAWLESNNALCLKEDDIKRDTPASTVPPTPKEKEERTLDDEGYFSGWRTIKECRKK